MKHPKEVTNKAIGSVGTINLHHLQYSSLDTMHTWVTHSVHESAEKARKMWKEAIHKFPTHTKWRIQAIKLTRR